MNLGICINAKKSAIEYCKVLLNKSINIVNINKWLAMECSHSFIKILDHEINEVLRGFSSPKSKIAQICNKILFSKYKGHFLNHEGMPLHFYHMKKIFFLICWHWKLTY